jgi:hypothetical protein
MKSNIKLDIGGELQTGDFVSVAYTNSNLLGWFVEGGQYGSLKFITIDSVLNAKKYFEDYQNGTLTSEYWKKKFAKGFKFKDIRKDYIINWGANRALKHPDADALMKDSSKESQYIEAKEFLLSIKFPIN